MVVPDGHYTAVVDRFEGERAVLLLERDGELVDELAVRERRLPRNGREQDAVLRVMVRNCILVSARYDSAETERRTDEAQSRFDRLARRPDEDDSESE